MNNHSLFLRRRICLTVEASLDGDHFLYSHFFTLVIFVFFNPLILVSEEFEEYYCKEKLDASHSYSLNFKDEDRISPYNREFV